MGSPWSSEEDSFLKSNWPKKTARDIAQILGRSTKSILARRNTLGLIRKKNEINIIGQKFGYLTVISIAGHDKYYHQKVLCQCDCGNTVIIMKLNLFPVGTQKGCGCARKGLPPRLLGVEESVLIFIGHDLLKHTQIVKGLRDKLALVYKAPDIKIHRTIIALVKKGKIELIPGKGYKLKEII